MVAMTEMLVIMLKIYILPVSRKSLIILSLINSTMPTYVPKDSTKPKVREVALNSSETESETDSETETFQVQRARTRERFTPKAKTNALRPEAGSGFRVREKSVVVSMNRRLFP